MKIGTKVWLSKLVEKDNAISNEYMEPVEYVIRPNYLSVMPATARGYMKFVEFGKQVFNTWIVIANEQAFKGKFKQGDLMWVDGATPDNPIERANGNGASANAIVVNVVPINKTIEITLQRNQNENFS